MKLKYATLIELAVVARHVAMAEKVEAAHTGTTVVLLGTSAVPAGLYAEAGLTGLATLTELAELAWPTEAVMTVMLELSKRDQPLPSVPKLK